MLHDYSTTSRSFLESLLKTTPLFSICLYICDKVDSKLFGYYLLEGIKLDWNFFMFFYITLVSTIDEFEQNIANHSIPEKNISYNTFCCMQNYHAFYQLISQSI